MIEKLTIEQEKELPLFREKYFLKGISCEKENEAVVSESINYFYTMQRRF